MRLSDTAAHRLGEVPPRRPSRRQRKGAGRVTGDETDRLDASES
jgi:hypothetical protein